MKRFVIFSAARSGSSLVVSTLNRHPDLLCHGEIFHPRPKWHLKGALAAADHEALDRTGMAFVDLVFASAPDKKACGFKMWRNQASEIADRLLANESVDKIILERTNLLACYSSTVLAKETRVWNVGAGKTVPDRLADAEIDFDDEAFTGFAERRAELFALYKAKAKGRTLHATYDGIVRDGVGGLVQFLGLQATPPLEFGKMRLHSPNILERFSPKTRAAAAAAIEAAGHPEWALE